PSARGFPTSATQRTPIARRRSPYWSSWHPVSLYFCWAAGFVGCSARHRPTPETAARDLPPEHLLGRLQPDDPQPSRDVHGFGLGGLREQGLLLSGQTHP